MPSAFGGSPGIGVGGGSGAGGKGIPRVTLSIVGLKKALKQMDNLKVDVVLLAREATIKQLERLLEEAKANTPVDTARLQDSGRIFKPSVNKNAGTVKFQVIFGALTVRGRFVDYAWLVHETHKRKPKFLENAANKHLPGMEKRIARDISNSIRIRG